MKRKNEQSEYSQYMEGLIVDTYKKGYEEGYEFGMKTGFKQGVEVGQLKAILTIADTGVISYSTAADMVGMSEDVFAHMLEQHRMWQKK